MTDMTQIVMAFVILRTLIVGLVRPYGQAFKVTAKGLSSEHATVQWSILWPLACIAGLNLYGVLTHLSQFTLQRASSGYVLNIVWSIFNILMLLVAALVCIEPPKRRRDERFNSGEPAVLELVNGTKWPCILKDISLGGASLILEAETSMLSAPLALSIDGGSLVLPLCMTRSAGKMLSVRFDCSVAQRRELIVRLFTGLYHNSVEEIRGIKVFSRLLSVLVS
jgi:cellulose synthase (UDP-forming)